MHKVGNIIECVQSLERGPFERHTLLIPSNFTNVAVSRVVSETSAEADSSLTMPIYEPNGDIFLSLVHIAIKIRTDKIETPGQVSETDAIGCVPCNICFYNCCLRTKSKTEKSRGCVESTFMCSRHSVRSKL